MMKFDNKNPGGIRIGTTSRTGIELAPVMVRQMTDDEREQYGPPQKRKRGETACPWAKRLGSKQYAEV